LYCSLFVETTLITLRVATSDDALVVTELVAALLTELGGALGDVADVARDVLAREDRAAGFLAFEDRRVVGVILLSEGYAMFARGAFGQITELYVRPDLRSAGIAGRLLDTAVAHGRERGWRRIDVGAPQQPQWERTVAV
jgi:GNAT superfamily N-acetyltransferase